MRKEVHDYFHKLIFTLTSKIEPKFAKGDKEHGAKGMLWDMPDDELIKNFEDELSDLIIYWAEILRRRH